MKMNKCNNCILNFRCPMADESIPLTSNNHEHVYRDHLVCQICCKSADFLKRGKFENLNMFKGANKWDRKGCECNVVSSFVA